MGAAVGMDAAPEVGGLSRCRLLLPGAWHLSSAFAPLQGGERVPPPPAGAGGRGRGQALAVQVSWCFRGCEADSVRSPPGKALCHTQQLPGAWVKGQSAGGCRNNRGFPSNPKFWLRVSEPSELYVAVLQRPRMRLTGRAPVGDDHASRSPTSCLGKDRQAVGLHIWKVMRPWVRGQDGEGESQGPTRLPTPAILLPESSGCTRPRPACGAERGLCRERRCWEDG